MKLEGTLRTFPLRELIDMVTYSSVTGSLKLHDAGKVGHIYVRDGHLYHADQDDLRGTDALTALLEFSEQATFTFVSDTTVDEKSIWGDTEFHLQSAERAALRWRRVRPMVRSMDLIPQLLLSRESAIDRVGPSYEPLLLMIDNRRNLNHVAAQLGWAYLDVAEATACLQQNGVIELHETPGAQSAQAPVDEPLRSADSGLFSRLRARVGRPASPEAEPSRAVEPLPTRSGEELIFQILRS